MSGLIEALEANIAARSAWKVGGSAVWKICTVCNVEKVKSEFGKNKMGRGGLRSYCKQCKCEQGAKYYENNKEKCQAATEAWRLSHLERVKQSAAKNRKKNPEMHRARERGLPVSDLHAYVQSKFSDVIRGPMDMHEYQNTAVNFLLSNPFSALFVDLGLGKSCITLTAIMHLIMRFEVEHVLVIAPVRVCNETWPTEIRSWQHTAPLSYVHVRETELVDSVNAAGQVERNAIKRVVEEQCMWDAISIADTKKRVAEVLNSKESKAAIGKARLLASRAAVRDHFRRNPATIHIVNRENTQFIVDAWGRDFPYPMVVVDESSCMRDHKSNRFKALKRVRPLIKRMHQLTATPAAETYMHLFAQIYLLDLGERFGKSITKFRDDYFVFNKYTYTYKLRDGAEERIAEKIADICLTMRAEQYLDLAKPVMLMDKVILSDEQMTLYATMQEDFIVQLPSGEEVEAETAAALSQKLAQMASGVLYETVLDDDGDGGFKKRRVVHHLHDHKIDALQNLVEEAQGETLLVAYWHESSLTRLKQAFPKAVVMDREGSCVKAWNAGKIAMLLVHPQSAAHGLNLQFGGRRIVFFDLCWSLELYLQLIGRLARQGQKLVVMVHHLIAQGTIDEIVIEALREKFDMQEVLFAWLRKIRNRKAASAEL